MVTSVQVARMQHYLGEERAFDVWGVTAMGITPPMAFSRDYPDTKGVVITGLRPGHPPEVARPPLERGDVVVAIGGDPVEDLDGFKALQDKHKDEKSLLVRFRRDRGDMVTALDMTRKPPRRAGRELSKAWLGVRTQVLTTDIAEALGLEGKQGFRVTWVLPLTQAQKAGLQPGDVITALDGDPLKASRLQDAELLRRRIEDMDIGSDVTLTVLRDGKEQSIDVTLAATPATASDAKTAKDEVLEYEVRELAYLDKVDNDWPMDVKGLVVSNVVNGGWANVAGLESGDLLVSLQDEPIETIQAFEAATKRIAEEKPKHVKIFVRRGRSTAYVFLEPDWSH
jgi:serine protease Do